MWQPHRNCSWDPTGTLRIGKQTMTPCNAKINEELCYDDFFGSCFSHFLNWSGTGPVRLDANGTRILNDVITTLTLQATMGAKITLALGGLFDLDAEDVVFVEGVTEDVKSDIRKTINTCKGWMLLLKEKGEDPKTQHLNQPGIFADTDFDASGENFIGDILNLFDSLKSKAKPKMRTLINKGSINDRRGLAYRPLFKVSQSIFNAIVEAYNRQCISNVCTNPRLTARDFAGAGNDARSAVNSQRVYYIDGMPVVPLSDINCYDEYFTGTLHFAAITASGNISLGGSFGNIPDLNTNTVGLMIDRETSAKEFGKWYWLAHALLATNIADTDYIVASQEFVLPTS